MVVGNAVGGRVDVIWCKLALIAIWRGWRSSMVLPTEASDPAHMYLNALVT